MPNPLINFEREIDRFKELTPEFLHMLQQAFQYIYDRIEAGGTTVSIQAASSTSSSGSVATSDTTRVGNKSVTTDSVTVTFSDPLPSANYQVFAVIEGSDGSISFLSRIPNTKGASGFTYSNLYVTGTLYYQAEIIA